MVRIVNKFFGVGSHFFSTLAGLLLAGALSQAMVHGADVRLATSAATAWPMFHKEPALTGQTKDTISLKPVLLWSFDCKKPVRSSAAIVSGMVFIGTDDDALLCLDLNTGKQVWRFAAGGSVESSPLVISNSVFFGSSDGVFHAVRAGDGKELWSRKTDDKILGSANCWTNKGKVVVLVGSYDYHLYALDATQGGVVWSFETGNYINGTPAIWVGNAVFGGCDGMVHVVSLADGKELKQMDAGGYIAGSVAINGNRAYFGQMENDFVCLDVTKGQTAWTFHDRNFPYYSSPAIWSGKVVFGGRDKIVHCIAAADGKPLWAFPTKGKVDSSPAICGDKVVVGSDDGFLYLLSFQTGKELWSYEIGSPVASSPAVANGKIVVGADDGVVYCFGEKRK
jgi:outer membrane protein assembly factor BamB